MVNSSFLHYKRKLLNYLKAYKREKYRLKSIFEIYKYSDQYFAIRQYDEIIYSY